MTYGDYPNFSSFKKILVVKLRHLGDVLLTGPVLTALQSAIPDARIDAYIYEEALPMLEGHSALHRCLTYDRKWKKMPLYQRLFQEWRLLRQIRKEGYDCVINLTEGDRGALVARISGAPVRVGFEPKRRKHWYTHLVKHCPTQRHTVERNLDALRRMGIFPTPSQRELSLHVPPYTPPVAAPYILLHPTSRWLFKCLPIHRMRELVQTLLARGHTLVLTSGPDETEKKMVHAIAHDLPVTVLAGQTTLKELAALIQQSELLICVDSVPLHMASALKKPVVALFGPTSDITWGPWRNPHARVVTQPFSCRPCYQDGCGGSKYSDCLHTLPLASILCAIDEVRTTEEVETRGNRAEK